MQESTKDRVAGSAAAIATVGGVVATGSAAALVHAGNKELGLIGAHVPLGKTAVGGLAGVTALAGYSSYRHFKAARDRDSGQLKESNHLGIKAKQTKQKR